MNEAKRTYGILNIGSNVAPIMGGTLALTFSNSFSFAFSFLDRRPLEPHDMSIDCFDFCSWHCRNGGLLLDQPRVLLIKKNRIQRESTDPVEVTSSKKPRLSLRESIRYIFRSRYLVPLAIIVLGYNISINFTDVLWKEQFKRFFTDPNEMLEHMSRITVGIGILATLGGFSFL